MPGLGGNAGLKAVRVRRTRDRHACRAMADLNAADRRLVQLLVTGMTVQEIGARIELEPAALQARVDGLLRRLGLENTAELIFAVVLARI